MGCTTDPPFWKILLKEIAMFNDQTKALLETTVPPITERDAARPSAEELTQQEEPEE